jgi:hypothetical protein
MGLDRRWRIYGESVNTKHRPDSQTTACARQPGFNFWM